MKDERGKWMKDERRGGQWACGSYTENNLSEANNKTTKGQRLTEKQLRQ